jgi:hypothetical protein
LSTPPKSKPVIFSDLQKTVNKHSLVNQLPGRTTTPDAAFLISVGLDKLPVLPSNM